MYLFSNDDKPADWQWRLFRQLQRSLGISLKFVLITKIHVWFYFRHHSLPKPPDPQYKNSFTCISCHFLCVLCVCAPFLDQCGIPSCMFCIFHTVWGFFLQFVALSLHVKSGTTALSLSDAGLLLSHTDIRLPYRARAKTFPNMFCLAAGFTAEQSSESDCKDENKRLMVG